MHCERAEPVGDRLVSPCGASAVYGRGREGGPHSVVSAHRYGVVLLCKTGVDGEDEADSGDVIAGYQARDEFIVALDVI